MIESAKIRILIADDHTLVRDGIRMRLEPYDHIEIIAEAETGLEAVKLEKELKPDIVMMDVSMPEMNGLEAAAAIRASNSDVKILILSIYDTPEYVREAITKGANGYILKDISAPDMVAALGSVQAGGLYLSSKIGMSLAAMPGTVCAKDNRYSLTTRELEVLARVAQGEPNKTIAAALDIGVRTVESHRQNIRTKVGGGNAAELTHIAVELGLLPKPIGL